MAPRLKRTPLFEAHRRAGARMVEFAGWEMPVQYQGVIDEHLAVRSRAGLFDVSHMGEIEVRGAGALESCQFVGANDVARLQVHQAQYNLLLNEQGGVVDDVIVYRINRDAFFICVNAANTEKDFHWLCDHVGAAVQVEDHSSQYAQLALQGPLSASILQPLSASALDEIKPFHFVFTDIAAIRCLVARTGYTGEDGFELYCQAAAAGRLWDVLIDSGSPQGLVAAGLGARDTLRLEKAYPLYGHELSDSTTPLDAGLEWVVKFDKPSFMGRETLLRQRAAGTAQRLVGLELLAGGIARSDYPLFKADRKVGRVTSGTKSPSLGKAIALAYVSSDEAAPGNLLEVEIRGRKFPAKIVATPFYRRSKRSQTG